MKRLARRAQHTVTPVNAGQVLVSLGPDRWLMNAREARQLVDQIHDALETAENPR